MITTPSARAASRAKSASDSAPTDFDATTNPIIARHWFGVEPFHQIGDVAAVVVAGLVHVRIEGLRETMP